jgi:hypothetical protein
MRVDEKITRGEYFEDIRFGAKKRATNGAYERTRGDNEWPKSEFERDEQFALISWHFYYFGAKAIDIPERFRHLEKKGPGFRSHFDQTDIDQFLRWLARRPRLGKQGEPCYRELPKEMTKCGSSC